MADTQLSGATLIREITTALHGDNLETSRRKLRSQLDQYLGTLREPPITRQAIKRWFDTENASVQRPRAIAFLHDFLLRRVDQTTLEDERLQKFQELFRYTATYANAAYVSSKAPEEGGGLGRMARYIIDANNSSVRDENNDLFYTSLQIEQTDQSYYLVYRFSTTSGSVVKTFLVCKRPQPHFIHANSFVQFMRGGPEYVPDLVRESQGVILKMEKTYVWLGYTYRVNAESAENLPEYQLLRIESKKRPMAIETISAEYDDIGLDRSLFPGLALTSAAMNQPVVARIAMLHLGTTQSLGRIVTHDQVSPTEISLNDLAQDLQSVVARLKQIGCRSFGRSLNSAMKANDWEVRGADRLAEKILMMLNNKPAADRDGERGTCGMGAIETFANHGNRPRP